MFEEKMQNNNQKCSILSEKSSIGPSILGWDCFDILTDKL